MRCNHIPNGVWVTIGIYLWTDTQEIVAEARRTGTLKNDRELFSGAIHKRDGGAAGRRTGRAADRQVPFSGGNNSVVEFPLLVFSRATGRFRMIASC
jgi:hypothetical protein